MLLTRRLKKVAALEQPANDPCTGQVRIAGRSDAAKQAQEL